MVDGSHPFNARRLQRQQALQLCSSPAEYQRPDGSCGGRTVPVIAWSPGLVIPPISSGRLLALHRSPTSSAQRFVCPGGPPRSCVSERVDNRRCLLAAWLPRRRYATPCSAT